MSIKKLLLIFLTWKLAAIDAKVLSFYVIAAISYLATPFTCSILFFAF